MQTDLFKVLEVGYTAFGLLLLQSYPALSGSEEFRVAYTILTTIPQDRLGCELITKDCTSICQIETDRPSKAAVRSSATYAVVSSQSIVLS